MRRTQLNFEVHGSNHQDLVEQAQIRYASYTGKPDAVLPASTSMEVNVEDWDGAGNIISWRGEVTVSITA